MLEFLCSIPDVVWSGVCASLFTLCGVMISNHNNTKRLLLQLEHDASEKAIERVNSLRREIYLLTVEELVKANAHLAALPQMDLTKGNFGDGLLGFSAAAARLQLVAEPETTLLVARLQRDYTDLAIDLMTHLLPIGNARTDIKIADDLYNQSQSELNRVLAEMARQNETGNPDPQIFSILQKTFDFQKSQSSGFAQDRTRAWQRFNDSNIAFQRFLLTRLLDLQPKQIPVLIAIRRDLGLPAYLPEFEAEMKAQSQTLVSKLNALIKDLGAS